MNDFDRKLRLAEFFLDKSNTDDSLVSNPSKFTPKPGRDKEMDTFLYNINKQNLSKTSNRISNINKRERKAITDLLEDKNIILKEADKGGGIVIMNKDFYQKIMEEHLNDLTTYKEIELKEVPQIEKKIEKLVDKFKEELTDKERDYLKNYNTKMSNIYGLPKIHKSGIISKAIKSQRRIVITCPDPTDLKFRPIVAGPSCPTSRLSHLIHLLLKPFLPMIPSFLKDSYDFLKSLPDKINPADILVTSDITSLYTNIPHQLGLQAVDFWITKHPDLLPYRIPKSFILQAIDLILTNNFFQFNNKIFLQTSGTAMGTKMAPIYANLTIGFLETKLYDTVKTKMPTITSNRIYREWKRYLDDCFIIWKDDNHLLECFLEILNNLHPAIHFTIETSSNSIPFLDVLVIKKTDKLETDIYRKPTDTMNYVDFRSCHPRHTKIAIPYNLANRIDTIVSNPVQKELRLTELKNILISKHYPAKLIDNSIERAINPQKFTSLPKEPQKLQIPIITTQNPNNPEVFPRIKTLFQNCTGKTMLELQDKYRLIKSKRQPRNLKKILTKAAFMNKVDAPGSSKCDSNRCGTCPLIQVTSTFTFNHIPQTPFRIEKPLNCTSKNVIYVITCPGCNKEYIGQTSDLRKRVTIHKQQIREPQNRKLPVSKHLHACQPNAPIPFNICPLVIKNNQAAREILESHLIQRYKPELNRLD